MFGRKITPEVAALQRDLAVAETLIEVHKLEISRNWEDIRGLKDARRESDKVLENLRLAVVELQTLATQPAPQMWNNAPLRVTEDEEDAKWQLENGLIDKLEYEKILEDVGLEPNVEIHY